MDNKPFTLLTPEFTLYSSYVHPVELFQFDWERCAISWLSILSCTLMPVV